MSFKNFFNFQDYDIFATVVGLRYSGNWRYKTNIGGLTSIITIVLIMSILIYHINGYLNRSSIKMTFENIKYWNPPRLDLSQNFHIVVMMKYGNSNIIRDDIINISMDYIQTDLKKRISLFQGYL